MSKQVQRDILMILAPLVCLKRLAGPTLAYENAELSPEGLDLVQSFGWLIQDENSKTTDEESYGFRADVYGGTNMLRHGGGVRSVVCDGWNLKGIGVNAQLFGSDSGAMYSHGGMALFECFQEALIGEVLHVALPYGAVRPLACIDTGLKAWWDKDQKELPRRGILVRQDAVRPAHFMRAPYFIPTCKQKSILAGDVQRTEAAIKNLPRWISEKILERPGVDVGTNQIAEVLTVGLHAILRRHAEQFAAAAARRVIHGSLGPSNTTLDGRWIDFGSTTFLPGYDSIRFLHSYWHQYQVIPAVFKDLVFYIRKYLPEVRGVFSEREFIRLIRDYEKSYLDQLVVEFCQLAGFPTWLIKNGGMQLSTLTHALASTMINIARAGNPKEPYDGYPDESSKFGSCRIQSVMHLLVRHEGADRQATLALREALDDENLLTRLLLQYAPVRDYLSMLARHEGISERAFFNYRVLSTRRQTEGLSELYRKNLIRDTISLAENPESVVDGSFSNYAATVIDKAWRIYGKAEGWLLPCWKSGSGKILFDARKDAWLVQDEGRVWEVPLADGEDVLNADFASILNR